jgi:hypothetical protein
VSVASDTSLLGSVLAYLASFQVEVFFLVSLPPATFSTLEPPIWFPEVKRHREFWTNVVLFVAFASGLVTLLVIRAVLRE